METLEIRLILYLLVILNFATSYTDKVNKNTENDVRSCSEDKSRISKYSEERSFPSCSRKIYPTESSKEKAEKLFWKQADFGLVSGVQKSLLTLCTPEGESDSRLLCAPDMQYCRANHIYIDFSAINFNTMDSFQNIFFKSGQLGGHCKLDKVLLQRQNRLRGGLLSWFDQLKDYSELPFQPSSKQFCDVVVETPTMFVQLDFAGNMYHHFCDFINIFISQHINTSLSRSNIIMNWDASMRHYRDPFGDTWSVFSDQKLQHIRQYKDKKVCFKDAIFAIPPRNPFTLYYGTSMPQHCQRSHLVRDFSDHILEGLNINRQMYTEEIRVTFLSRSTQYRRILNEKDLVEAINSIKDIKVSLVDYHWDKTPFSQQLERTRNTDIFIGIHGAGLTHFLFLPEWAVGFELFHTDDPGCYRDLASISGVKYLTWEDRSKLKMEEVEDGSCRVQGAKFCNYVFDVEEFLRIFKDAVNHVRNKRPENFDCK